MEKAWRLIDSGQCSAFYNMAIDEALAVYVRRKKSPPVLRLYAWDMPSISLGCFQKASDIDIKYCIENRIPIVRRLTGGRAILHGDELTYSFSVRTDNDAFSGGLLDSYRKISMAFNLAFGKIGIQVDWKKQREKGRVLTRSPLCFKSSSFGEILIGNQKIIGSAQKRWKDGLLQQGSIPYHIDASSIKRVFRLHTDDLKDEMSGLKDLIPDFNDRKFRDAIKVSFEEAFNIRFISDHPSQDEEALAQRLVSEKYQAFE